RRMSLLLRGYLPSHRDIAELKATPESAREEFFQRKLKDYTSDIFFRRKFAWRTKSLFRLQQDSRLEREESLSDFRSTKPAVENPETPSIDTLAKILAEPNSWDDLMSSPAFAYQRELREALDQVQSGSLIFEIASLYSQLARVLKSGPGAVARIRAHLKGEYPIRAEDIPVPSILRTDAQKWANVLSKYKIPVTVDTSSNEAAFATFKRIEVGFDELYREGTRIVERLQGGIFSFGAPNSTTLREDREGFRNSKYRRDHDFYKDAVESLPRAQLRLSEIVSRSSIIDNLFAAAEQVYLYESSLSLEERRYFGDFRSFGYPGSRDIGIPLGIPAGEIRKSLEAAAIRLWEEGRFRSGLPLVLSGDLRERYNQTKYSLSAAFYRIYFCDEMKLVALARDDELSRLANGRLRFGGSSNPQTRAKTSEQRHASDPLCQGCHRKLDPVQKLADQNGKLSSQIKIVYDDENGKEQSFVASSPMEVVQQIKSQRMYQICQVRRFWNWYIGEDVPLTGQRLEQMLTSYRNHKSIPEFVRTVVSQPEFSRIPQVTDKLTFEGVRPILSRCNDCHSSEALLPSFTQTPFTLFAKGEEARAEHVDWLRKIVKMTDLVHGAKNAKMPPKEAGWTLNNTAVHQLARWVYFLAPDAKGQPTITSTQRDRILADASPEFLEKISLDEPSKPSFRSTYRRYLEGIDFVKIVHQIFEAPLDPVNQACGDTFSQKRFAFGWFDHITGGPTTLAPGGDFQMTWAKCLELIFKNKFEGRMSRAEIQNDVNRLAKYLRDQGADARRYETLLAEIARATQPQTPRDGRSNETLSPVLPESYVNELREIFFSRNQDYVDDAIPLETLIRRLVWNRLTQDQRLGLVAQLVNFAYPEEIFPAATIATIRTDLYQTMDQLSTAKKLDLYDTIRSSVILLLSREEFLTL
ncbi:MAG: hypothetical protein AB7P49_14950, partial [Bdellovibrionales bacterium]